MNAEKRTTGLGDKTGASSRRQGSRHVQKSLGSVPWKEGEIKRNVHADENDDDEDDAESENEEDG